jgi:hypothetical protein
MAAPTALSLIAVTFPEGRPRNRAVAVYSAMAIVGVVAGGQAAVSALLRVAAQGVWVPVPLWSWTMATACCWVSREPAENA